MSTPAQHIAIIDCGSPKVDEIARMLAACGATCEKIPLAAAVKTAFEPFQALVISGGPALFTDTKVGPGLLAQFGFLDTVSLPILGICLGHQAIGIKNGAEVFRGPENRTTTAIRIRQPHPLVAGLGNLVHFTEDHCEGISLPPHFTLIADSADYKVEIMASRERPLYGVQFHPEVSGDAGLCLIKNFARLVSMGSHSSSA